MIHRHLTSPRTQLLATRAPRGAWNQPGEIRIDQLHIKMRGEEAALSVADGVRLTHRPHRVSVGINNVQGEPRQLQGGHQLRYPR